MAKIPNDLYNKLKDIGIIMSEVRKDNVGNSDYSKHTIQPWSIWLDYHLNPWDADIVKRVLRTKEESGKTRKESRIMDYEKIIHICKERIRQLKSPTITFSKSLRDLTDTEINAYTDFLKKHNHNGKCDVSIVYSTNSGIGVGKEVLCEVCKERTDITDYSKW